MSDGEFPRQQQERPGLESEMKPEPRSEMSDYLGSQKLEGRRALVTGGDSGIGKAVAIAFAKEGADVAFTHLPEEADDAKVTRQHIERAGRIAYPLEADLSEEEACKGIVSDTVGKLGGLDVLVLHHGTQWHRESLEEITTEQWETTLRTNLTSFFWITSEALPHLGKGSAIVMTGSVNGYRGNASLIDYAVSKGGIHTLAQSLSQSLQEREIRVNVVAPGPVWTPLIPATMPPDKVAGFGQQAPMERAAQPDELAPSYVFLASNQLSSYYTGQVLGAIGGEVQAG